MTPSPSRPSDQSLLDRLNALKSTGVTLDKSPNTAILPDPDAQPSSKEDALAARLRILRSQSASSSRDGASAGAPPLREPPVLRGPLPEEEGTRQVPGVPKDHPQKRPPIHAEFEAVDEEALDELLGALGDEEFDLAVDEDAVPPPDRDPKDEAKRVADLLESLGKDAGDPASTGPSNTGGDDPDDDDSDGEPMTRDVDTLLSQLRDEINSLPPSTAAAPNDGEEEEEEAGDQPAFTLPAVPSQLVDPVPGPDQHSDSEDAAVERDLAARMASLRGLGHTSPSPSPSTSTTTTDPLGLPSAPTFRPQDRDTSSEAGRRLGASSKYTDADQQTWCVVCLDDATVSCAGCDGDGYCARCWREMHTGPSAGFEERGHVWVRFGRAGHY